MWRTYDDFEFVLAKLVANMYTTDDSYDITAAVFFEAYDRFENYIENNNTVGDENGYS